MVTVTLIGSPSLNQRLHEELQGDFRNQDIELPGFPRVGERIGNPDGPGTYRVLSVVWWPNQPCPTIQLGP